MSASDPTTGLEDAVRSRLEQLRRDFDLGFAEPASAARTETVDLLLIRVGDAPYALPLEELRGVERDIRLVSLPGAGAGHLGLAGIRGRPVAVLGLGAFAGEDDLGRRRWLAIAGDEERVALAFSDLDGYERVPRGQLVPVATGRPHVASVVHLRGTTRGLLSPLSILAAVRDDRRLRGTGAP